MATLVLSAAGAALGGTVGGSVAGLSMAALGQAAGAVVGRTIDQRILGGGSRTVETGRTERYRLLGASEGAPIGVVYGRMRVGGQVVWATRFQEHVNRSGGGRGKAGSSQPQVSEYSYSVNLAVALGEGEINSVGRVWADGVEISTADIEMRVYSGSNDQEPDPKIAAVEGLENTPAFRGTAYVVFEDLDLSPFGNRVPQFNFEVSRAGQVGTVDGVYEDLSHAVHAVALIPGSGEFALSTEKAHFDDGFGRNRTANVHSNSGKTDFATSVDTLTQELPNCRSTSLVVSWFGNDLRCGSCEIKPKVEHANSEAVERTWTVSGISRGEAELVPYIEGRPAYGGTPFDASVVQSINYLRDAGQDVVFYPFILMDQTSENQLLDPWTGVSGQPEFPWRGRITASIAPGLDGSPDGSSLMIAEVDAFFGNAQATDFSWDGNTVIYSGVEDWGFRRFILHNAHLCAAAGGVSAFCIGSELRGLVQLRDDHNQFIAVEHLKQLAADVRGILGIDTKIGYAADWSEYFGYQPDDGTNDRFFNLDRLWADDNIDFIGIDNYMPISDWRKNCDHIDQSQKSIYKLDYLMANVAGGEGFDWYYHSTEARDAQIRTAISDDIEQEPWAFRFKDVESWWKNPHYERVNGVRSLAPTAWAPESKPIWFTELGCPAVDFGTNQPNVFVDPKSSESKVPYASDGCQDEFIQMQYLRAVTSYWDDTGNNPESRVYDGKMLDMSKAHVWAWDSRPYPYFPDLSHVWSDGENYALGHWISGRSSARPLDSVVREICRRSGLKDEQIDTTHLYGLVRGYSVPRVDTGRAALQPLMLAYGFDCSEHGGKLVFTNRSVQEPKLIDTGFTVLDPQSEAGVEYTRASEPEIVDQLHLNFVRANGSYDIGSVDSVFPEYANKVIETVDVPLALTSAEAHEIVDRWITEGRISRDRVQLAFGPSAKDLKVGDQITIDDNTGRADYRIDRLENSGQLNIEASRVDATVYNRAKVETDDPVSLIAPNTDALPVYPLFLDLPLMTGDEMAHAPYVCATADPWPGAAAVYRSGSDSNYQLDKLLSVPAILGQTITPLERASVAIFDHGPDLIVELTQGELETASEEALISGTNLAAIGDGTSENWEIFQFEKAELVGPNRYALSKRVRGKFGSDAIIPDAWPVGSTFVLINGGLEQLDLPIGLRNITQHFRIGPGTKPYSDASYVYEARAFSGVGMKPYAPVYLSHVEENGDVAFSWIRRSRFYGQFWDATEVPVHEANESYRVQLLQNGIQFREAVTNTPVWSYTSAQRNADGITGDVEFRVAQVSSDYGPGNYRSLQFVI